MSLDNLLTTYKHSDDINRVVDAADAIRQRIAQLEAALAGMLSIEDSVTQGQERELREKWIPIARATLAEAKK